MAQKHMDRLSAVDATFLHQESPTTHMHIGGLVVLEGPAPAYDDFVRHIASRLHLVPRFRQRLATPPAQTGRPLWVDDPSFTLEYHVRHTGLPAPGGREQLERLAARVFGQLLDRARPLWEMWLVEGLEEGRFAILHKTHHALVDGVSGAELATVLFDLTPDYTPTEPQDWIPRPEPSGLELLAAGARDALSLSVSSVARVAAAVREPGEIVDTVRDAVDGLAEVARAGIDAAPRSPLNVPTGPHRRYRIVQGRLDDYKLVKNTFGGTVNDVVLSVVTGALARFLRGRGIGTADMRLRAAVPVSVRSSDKRLAMGNQITLMLAPLPVGVDDPLARLAEVRASMEGIKRSNQALGAATIAGLQRFAPPTLLAVSSRLSMSSRMYNILVTNVPGPQFPVYALGRRLLEIAPVAFLAPDHAVAIAIMSYDGGVDFGILADYDAVRDVDVIATGIADAIAELVALARAESEPRPARRVAGRSATPRADRPRTPRRAPAATARPRRGHGAG